MVNDAGGFADLADTASSCVRLGGQGSGTHRHDHDPDRIGHRRDLGQTHVGHLLGMGPRLTSFMILLIFYFGYLALWEAVSDKDTAADLTSILCIVGSVFAVLSRYAVNFWSQGLHQGASLSLDKETHVDNAFYFPLLVSMAGMVLLFVTLVLIRTRTEIRTRRLSALRAREV